MSKLKITLSTLKKIYNKHRKQYPENHYDSNQMCLMWSTDNPPDVIEDTAPFIEIQDAFDLSITEDEQFEMYNMTLKEAMKCLQKIKRTTN